jgi:small conductance mechanosensitive channel
MLLGADLLATIITFLVRTGLALLILLFGRFLAGKVRQAIERLLDQSQVNEALGPSAERIIRQVAYFGVLAAAVLLALVALGVSTTAIISVGSATIILLGIALRESLSNLVATLIIAFYGTYRAGEDIETMGKIGTVYEMQLFGTVLQTGDKTLITLSNGEILKDGVTNLSRLGVRRTDIEFLVEYGQDMARAEQIILDSLRKDPRAMEDPSPYVAVTKLDVNGVTMQARSLVNSTDYDRFMLDHRGRLSAELEAGGIRLAVPRQEIYLSDEFRATRDE